MTKLSNAFVISSVCTALIYPFFVGASERLLEAGISARTEYNDNIFLTDNPRESVTGVTLTPSLSGIIKESNWESKLNAKLKISEYSNHSIDGNDQLFDLSGQYFAERNIFSLNVNHNLDSNLNSTSTDFGIVGRRVDRTSQNITPQYTYLLTERLMFTLSYSYTNVDFDDIENTGFVPFITEVGTTSMQYELTQRDQVTLNFQVVDYKSKNNLQMFNLFTSNIGIDHKFSETVSADFSLGVSRRNSTNLDTTSFDFFGQTITRTRVLDFNNRGLVLDAGITQILESGNIKVRISRDDTTNSFGGADQVDRLRVVYDEEISSLWRYNVNIRFDNIESVSNTNAVDRDVIFFETRLSYSITSKWAANASYRYVARKFKSDLSEGRAPYSNRIYIGLNYNFPTLSTF
ncbi:hypothetical protein MNBD_GAMMA05-621 [hydrothermal vent metagenome]|uniref:Capsular polysaccharide synthesis enzyme CpsB n=1 Tax=hydrothermal vent metagenome TaxID=652676 RepID=A0A3B0WS86_9ZZZZ